MRKATNSCTLYAVILVAVFATHHHSISRTMLANSMLESFLRAPSAHRTVCLVQLQSFPNVIPSIYRQRKKDFEYRR